jgi:hypothetical protein
MLITGAAASASVSGASSNHLLDLANSVIEDGLRAKSQLLEQERQRLFNLQTEKYELEKVSPPPTPLLAKDVDTGVPGSQRDSEAIEETRQRLNKAVKKLAESGLDVRIGLASAEQYSATGELRMCVSLELAGEGTEVTQPTPIQATLP